MTAGYSNPERVTRLRNELTTWELYQVTVDKYYVEFWFENGHCLLNVAFRFELQSADRKFGYVYDVQAEGGRKFLNVDCLLRHKVSDVRAPNERQLEILFESGDTLIVHDNAQMRSAWFYRYNPLDHNAALLWLEEDEFGEEEY